MNDDDVWDFKDNHYCVEDRGDCNKLSDCCMTGSVCEFSDPENQKKFYTRILVGILCNNKLKIEPNLAINHLANQKKLSISESFFGFVCELLCGIIRTDDL